MASLLPADVARAERNRLRALELRQARLSARQVMGDADGPASSVAHAGATSPWSTAGAIQTAQQRASWPSSNVAGLTGGGGSGSNSGKVVDVPVKADYFRDSRAGYMLPDPERQRKIEERKAKHQKARLDQQEAIRKRRVALLAAVEAIARNGKTAATTPVATDATTVVAEAGLQGRDLASVEAELKALTDLESEVWTDSGDEVAVVSGVDQPAPSVDQPAQSADQPAPIEEHAFIPEPEGAPEFGTPCVECNDVFFESFLSKNFKLNVCNTCRGADQDEKYALITKSDARKLYLLADEDFLGHNNMFLPFITKKNPRHASWHEMQLYCIAQVEAVAFKKFGGEEGLEREMERRQQVREDQQQRKYDKQMRELRKATNAGTWVKQQKIHRHEFPPESEVYDQANDNWTKTCACGHSVTFEKM
ncbi:hypothetical protein CAOG_04165 [Capsaspora owczarzaki ATCC 30864]|uniref:XPA C-terminal domain-containing protein n=1 Tax=Capsaspora owczarzaki (strain ATCC 30864) TaxID=595528 RepID=A0A0D2UE26_CAPO3|nr:hypothetical protein CAOG_04165 [Capsaspora owczarzaki ATCC 30864]KJE93366.1 hypothetical protein CAOG_004165 [Capsaspora owczarzaki ATCC 30864]|eukprot:XP_004347990.1 hypothetical protein CAOG_04165 [Capsaspora owczarzaki ATCC 30864]